jgi:iron-sulfur cluster assembly protein
VALIITDSAANYLKSQTSLEYYLIRIGVKGGGCVGFSYFLELEKEIKEKDQIRYYNNLQVVIDINSLKILENTVIDLEIKNLNKNIVFNNPSETSKCGCGLSFGIDD